MILAQLRSFANNSTLNTTPAQLRSFAPILAHLLPFSLASLLTPCLKTPLGPDIFSHYSYYFPASSVKKEGTAAASEGMAAACMGTAAA